MRSPKVAFFENSYGQCAVQQSTVESMMTQMIRCSRNRLSGGTPCADSMNRCMSAWKYYSAAPIRIFKSASFSERVLPISDFLSLPNLNQFPHMRCHIQGQGCGNKMHISELFTVIGYLLQAVFKNRRGTFCAKCMFHVHPISKELK